MAAGFHYPIAMGSSDPTPAELLNALPPSGALMGLDLGTKTIGLAISDPGRRIASPLLTIRRTKFKADAEALLGHAATNAVAGLVLGLPLNMDGSEGPRVQSTRAFARNLSALTSLPIAFWDERLSTAAVTRTLLDADTSRKRRAALVDKMAAAYILQGALDRLANVRRSGA
jgi:putative Holliday junction resolvase